MYRQPSKRKQFLQRVAVYSLMTVTTVGLLTVLVFVILGYQYNSNDGKIEQGGLVQFDSRPTGADVTIDGAVFGTRTTSKTTMSAGQHFITMGRPGYKTWQKSVEVTAGNILWLNYPRLIPDKLESANVASFSAVTNAAASDDNKWLAVVESAAAPHIKLADITRDDAPLTTLTLPAGTYTIPAEGKSQTFSLDSWDPDSRFILVKHTYDDTKQEWIVVDTQNVNASKNVTTLLNIDAQKLLFSNGNSTILYGLIGGDIRKIDLGAATLSRPLVSHVADFSLYSDSMITFSSLADPVTKQRSVGYYIDGTQSARIVKTFPDDALPLHFTVGRYFGDTIEAIAYGNTVTILKGDLPRDEKTELKLKEVVALPFDGGVQYLSNMTDGRFVIMQSGSIYAVYDLELQKMTMTPLKGTAETTQKLRWLDNYTIWSDRDGTLRLYEFDGANQHDIMQVVPGLSVTLSPSGKYLYGITKSSDSSYHLTRVRLIL